MNINYLVRKVKLVILLFLLVQQGLHAQYQNINFEHVSSENNLFHFSINSILQDKTGFLWFGTRTGLNLYDGRKYIVYKTTNSDSSISNELIRVIYETKDGTLWIGTEKGLNKYDRDKRIFLRYINNPKNQESICDDKINGMVEDKNGNLWIATSNGLSKYDKKSDKFINYYSLPDNPNSIQSNMVSAIAIDNDGNLLLGLSTLGLDYVNLSKNHENGISKTLDIRHFSIKRASSSSVYISKILLDINNKIWIGTYGLGLFSVDKSAFSNLKGKNIVQDLNVTAYQGNKIGSKNISNNMVTDIIEDNNGNLWIGTFGGGVNIYYKNRNEFEYFKYDNKNGSSINSDYIKSLFIDRSNNIWIGTYTGGLNKYSPNQNKFKVYRNIPGDKSSLKSNLITSIFQDKKGILWIGTRTGLNRLDREKDQCDLYVYGSKESINDPCNLIRSSCEDNNNKLWVGSHDGLHCFDIIKKKYILKYNEPLQKLLLKNIIRTIILDDENNLWIGASGCLVKYNLSTNQFKKYIHIPNDPTSLNHNYVWSLYKDQFGNIWIGTREGLHKYNKDGDNFTRYILKTSPKLMYQENFISSICSDNHGIIWLGTFTGGIHRLTPHFKSDSKIPAYEQDSLSHFNISGSNEASIGGILIDKSQNLWAGSDNGILMLNNNRNISRLYDIRDRVASNELNTGSFFGSPTGEFFFGGNNGMISFFPEKIRHNTHVPNVVLTSFWKMKNEIYSGTEAAGINEIHLSYKDNNFTFTFSALDYSEPSSNQYKYKLEGYDEDWIDCGNKNEVSYMNLSGGEYTFRVKGSNDDKVWNETGFSIKVFITPPIWERFWFRLLVALFLLGMIYFYFRIKILRVEKQKITLERSVIIKTYDLKKANLQLENEITVRKKAEEEIIRTNALLSESNITKDKLFSIISHDLRGSIGNFMSMLRLLVEEPDLVGEKELRELLKSMEESAESTYNLLENLLNWARSQRGVLEHNPENTELNFVVGDVLSTLKHIAKSKQINLYSKINDLVSAYFDKNTINTVLRNLTSNALKFTKTNGNVWIDAEINDKFITVSVNDDGVGIQKNIMDKIFNAYQGVTTLGTGGEKGTGLGLMLCKEFVEKNGGKIWVESEPGKGSSFKFTLPKEKS